MTKTEAAEIIATDAIVWARNNGRTEVTKLLIEERMSELRGPNYAGTRKATAAWATNWRTALRIATREIQAQGGL
jgi:hypothetical protein